MEEKTIFSITLNNKNEIHSNIDLSSIEGEEDALRFIHSLLDEYKQEVLEKIREAKTPVEDDEFDF
ncbi:MAG: hypothetical protein PHF86_06335 [Candidatus Nanoarchaeia archaeon]|nr:hypothetical protein [Candidatus Nanoarchaeia archaeon]